MELERIAHAFSVCRVREIRAEDLEGEFCFAARTDDELSLVCLSSRVPEDAVAREDGWRALRIRGVLDFSLVGVLAPIANILARNRIGIFAVSTYNTDYILVKEAAFERALALLGENGYTIL